MGIGSIWILNIGYLMSGYLGILGIWYRVLGELREETEEN